MPGKLPYIDFPLLPLEITHEKLLNGSANDFPHGPFLLAGDIFEAGNLISSGKLSLEAGLCCRPWPSVLSCRAMLYSVVNPVFHRGEPRVQA